MSDVAASYRAGAEWFWEVGHREAPLSGEFSGESVPEITERFGLVRLDEDAFEEGFFESAAAFPEYGGVL